MDRMTLAAMQRHSMFLTAEHLHRTIDDHLKRIKIRLTPSAMKVMDVLRMHSKKAIGVSYLLIDTIVTRAQISRSSVERGIRQLEKVGIIKRIPQTRPKEGGDGANMYAFQPIGEGAQMKGREEQEKPTPSRDDAAKIEGNTGVSSAKQKILKTYVQEPRPSIPHYIPSEFVKAVKIGFSNVKMILEMWKRVIMFKRKEGISDSSTLLSIALEAWEYTKSVYRSERKEWKGDRIFQCFYGTMREIVNAQNNDTEAAEIEELRIPETDEELKAYLDERICEIKRTHGAESRFVLVSILAKEVQKLYPMISSEQARGCVECLGY